MSIPMGPAHNRSDALRPSAAPAIWDALVGVKIAPKASSNRRQSASPARPANSHSPPEYVEDRHGVLNGVAVNSSPRAARLALPNQTVGRGLRRRRFG
jgi:hypothetical protein